MNNYKIEVKQWHTPKTATDGVNEFIVDCYNKGVQILDITTHVTKEEDFMTYVFIFKLRR